MSITTKMKLYFAGQIVFGLLFAASFIVCIVYGVFYKNFAWVMPSLWIALACGGVYVGFILAYGDAKAEYLSLIEGSADPPANIVPSTPYRSAAEVSEAPKSKPAHPLQEAMDRLEKAEWEWSGVDGGLVFAAGGFRLSSWSGVDGGLVFAAGGFRLSSNGLYFKPKVYGIEVDVPRGWVVKLWKKVYTEYRKNEKKKLTKEVIAAARELDENTTQTGS